MKNKGITVNMPGRMHTFSIRYHNSDQLVKIFIPGNWSFQSVMEAIQSISGVEIKHIKTGKVFSPKWKEFHSLELYTDLYEDKIGAIIDLTTINKEQ